VNPEFVETIIGPVPAAATNVVPSAEDAMAFH
jgi:hypothetical protein